jgi:hypothetical protein
MRERQLSVSPRWRCCAASRVSIPAGSAFSVSDHGLMPAGCDRTLPYPERIAPGFPMLTAWLASR